MSTKICSVEGCGRKAVANGLCQRCYGRKRRPPKTECRPNRKSLLAKYLAEEQIMCMMRQRCYNPKSSSYKNYGAKGIGVCERWRGRGALERFLEDMGPRPEGLLPSGRSRWTLDRIDSTKDYSPDNCRWVDWWEQNSHTSRSNEHVGVIKAGNLWRAELTIYGKTHRKHFKRKEDAIAYRKQLEEELLSKYRNQPNSSS